MDFNKKWLGSDLNDLAIARALDQIRQTGLELPCTIAQVVSPGIVTVNFEVDASPAVLQQVTVPVFMNPYERPPFKKGDPGVCTAATVRLGGLSGLGSGTPSLWTRPGNLAALVFLPLGTTAYETSDPEAYVLYDQTRGHSLAVSGSGVKVDTNMTVTPNELAFFGGAPAAKQAITGALSAVTDPNAKAVLESIVDAIAAYTLATKSTT